MRSLIILEARGLGIPLRGVSKERPRANSLNGLLKNHFRAPSISAKGGSGPAVIRTKISDVSQNYSLFGGSVDAAVQLYLLY